MRMKNWCGTMPRKPRKPESISVTQNDGYTLHVNGVQHKIHWRRL